MKFLAGRTNRATFAVLMLGYAAVFSLAVAFQIKIPGEVLLTFICVPRLHDVGRSGWWMIFPIIFELAAGIATMLSVDQLGIGREAMKGLGILAGFVVLLLPAIVLLFIPGQKGPNRFGDAPARGIGWARMARSS